MSVSVASVTGALFLVVASAAAQETATGAIAGVVRFTGMAPAPRKFLSVDGATLTYHDLVVDEKTKGLRYVAVRLEDTPAAPLAKDAKTVVIDQRELIFTPRVAVAQEGQKVRFENNDSFNHAVQSATSKVENLFNVVTPQGQPFDFEFKAQRNPVQIGCPIHPWMRAWIVVTPHPFAAVTDEVGKFRIARAPVGKYKLAFLQPDTGLRETRTVEVVAGQTTMVNVDWKMVK